MLVSPAVGRGHRVKFLPILQTAAGRMEVGAGSLPLGLVLGPETCQGQHMMIWPLFPAAEHLTSYSPAYNYSREFL